MSENATIPSLDQLPPLLTVAQVAKLLQLNPTHVRDMLRTGTLPGVKMGTGTQAAWRIPKHALIRQFQLA